MSKTPVAIAPEIVFTIETMLPLMQAHSDILQQIIFTEVHDKIIRLITFIQQYAKTPLPTLLLQSTYDISTQLNTATAHHLQATYPSAKKKYDTRRRYMLHPEKCTREEKRKALRHGRNFAIITSLAKTLQSDNLLSQTLLPQTKSSDTL